MSELIFTLTRDGITLPDARVLADQALATDVQHIGFADVGLPRRELRALVAAIQGAGRSAHLEIAAVGLDAERASVRAAVDLGVDYVIGGTHWREVGPLLDATDIAYFPSAGPVRAGSRARDGTPERLCAHVDEMGHAVDGVTLSAGRHPPAAAAELLRAVVEGTVVPVIACGSIDSPDRIAAVSAAGAWAFTVAQADCDGRFVPGGGLVDQLEEILDIACLTNDPPRDDD